MLEVVTAALENQDYRRAAELIQQWQQQAPADPWLKLCIGQYQEARGQLTSAAKTYRQILQKIPHAKVLAQARQGLERLSQRQSAQQEAARNTAKAAADGGEPGILLLEPVQGAARTAAAQGLARVMQLDAYTARMQLPGKGWRVYRVGSIGELRYLEQALQTANTPAFCAKLADVNQSQVFRVNFFRAVEPQAKVVCQSQSDQLGAIAFDWSEVSQCVVGMLPIFEQVIDLGPWGKLQRKEKTQDYAQVLDLHLHQRQSILRLCDRAYEFHSGNPLNAVENNSSDLQNTTRLRWNALSQYIQNQISGPVHSGFMPFAEGAIEYIDLLSDFPTHLNLLRLQPSNWDAAFQLYSGLHFLRHQTTPP
ncbi:MAG: tetratricopeptide repeat protein [Leptolyngbyaceae cyanobacterium SM1_1_3]|nr:tetratricopeptide repeat protein [Leptolyngbyaceae cyanobacterium SM1_1_3]NJN02172.1 tetratricopeptide repeat protein [Leptolyngbyaceae cyanobacterium RM1_1_2]NJO08948.1 tetratricopeptide repeat protein [Leptolyngbyaceae cyanobacterium SL_1_1]